MRFDVATSGMMRSNQRNWDARTPVHVASEFYGLDGTRDPLDWFASFEWTDLGALDGLDVLHMQCHLGTETQAFAGKGARSTVGLDFSGAAVEHARRIAADAGANVEYLHSDVYDAVQALDGRRFDLVYTGKGSLFFLPDLPQWSEIVAELLRPGGALYVVEFHPVLHALGSVPLPEEGPELLLRNDYLAGGGPVERDVTYTYTDGPPLQHDRVGYEWMYGLGDLINAVVGAGLTVQSLRETELLPWPRWESMVQADNGWWRLPDTDPRVPLMYALRAVKPV